MKKLIVAEKPSVARDIARVLGAKTKGEGYLEGDQWVVTWALGHLVSLQEPDELDERYKRWRMEDLPILPDEIPLKVLPKTRSQFSAVKKLMLSKEISSIVCATDAAREGELIFRYIYQAAKCKKPVERLWISSMTDEAIRKGFENLRPSGDYDALYDSARMRSVADWLVGMNASRAFTLRYNALLPLGRVQTPTLALLVERDLAIANFVSQPYWEIRADFGDYTGLWLDPETDEPKCLTREKAEDVQKAVKGKTGRVTESIREKKRTPPPQLYDLTALQRAANSRYGFSADKTLKIAQSLYEKYKLLTYPRTDSRHLPDDMRPKILQAIDRLSGEYRLLAESPEFNRNMHSKRFYDGSKVSDHHAIVLTEKKADPAALPPDERKIYDMVVRSVLAMHYPDYQYESAKVITAVEGHLFRTAGTTPLSPGWKAVYPQEKEEAAAKGTAAAQAAVSGEGAPASKRKTAAKNTEDEVVPDLSVGDERTVLAISVRQQKTKPPSPHTDASLLSLMEHAGQKLEDEELRERMKSSGLGTPATRAATIERLIKVGLARRKGKALISTEKGQKLISVAPKEITSAVTTGKWEKALYAMANNPDPASRAEKVARFRQGIFRFSRFLVEAAKNAPRDVQFEREPYKKKRASTYKKPAASKPDGTGKPPAGK